MSESFTAPELHSDSSAGGQPRAALLFVILAPAVYFIGLLRTGTWNYFDLTFPVSVSAAERMLRYSAPVWNAQEFLGVDNTINGRGKIPSLLVIIGFLKAGIPASVVQYLFYVLVFSAGIGGMILLFRELALSRTAGIVAGLVFVFNPWVVARLHFWLIIQAYCLVPFALASLLKVMGGKWRWVGACCIAFAFIVVSPHVTGMLVFFVVAAAIRDTIQWSNGGRERLGRLAATAAVVFSALSPITIPALARVLTAGAPGSLNDFTGAAARINGQRADLFHAFILDTFHDPAVPLVPRELATAFAFLLALLVPVAIIRTRDQRIGRISAVCGLISAVGIALSVAGRLYSSNVQESLFILPWQRTDPTYSGVFTAVGYAVVIGLGVATVHRAHRLLIATLVVFITIMASGGPKAFSSGPTAQLTYPSDYVLLDSLRTGPGERTLLLPADWTVKHKWAPYPTSGLDHFIIPSPYFGPQLLEAMPRQLREGTESIVPLMLEASSEPLYRMTSTRLVVVRTDIESSFRSGSGEAYMSSAGANDLQAKLEKLPFLSLLRKSSGLAVFRYNGNLPGRISLPSNIVVREPGTSLQAVVERYPLADAVVDASDRPGKGEHLVVLNEGYDSGWTLAGGRHVLVSSYANGWITSVPNRNPRYVYNTWATVGIAWPVVATALFLLGRLIVRSRLASTTR